MQSIPENGNACQIVQPRERAAEATSIDVDGDAIRDMHSHYAKRVSSPGVVSQRISCGVMNRQDEMYEGVARKTQKARPKYKNSPG